MHSSLLRLRGALNQYRGDATQMAKRAMVRLAIVPPPFRVQIDITDRCNFRCPTCSKWRAAPSAKELDLDDWRVVFERISGIPVFREISISGGEPFARPDILEIVALAKQRQLRVVLISNGWFVNSDVLQGLEEIGLDRLMVSLNSLDESVHDSSRAVQGSYQRIMQLVDAWLQGPQTTDLCLAAMVLQSNCGELAALASFAHEKGLSGIIFQVLAPDEAHYPFSRDSRMPEPADSWHAHSPLWVRGEATLAREISRLLQMQKQGCPIINPPTQLRNFSLYYRDPEAVKRLTCLGTLSRMYIDPLGDIRLCYGYSPIGNILEDDPLTAWRSEQARAIRRESRECTRLCRMLNNNL